MDIKIRDYIPNDEENIVPLLELIFPSWPPFTLEGTKIEHWRWKYLDNPLKSMFITVVEEAGKIIGVNHALFVNVIIGENRYRTRALLHVLTRTQTIICTQQIRYTTRYLESREQIQETNHNARAKHMFQ